MSDLVKTEHMSGDLVRRLDGELGKAIASVERGQESKANVTLSFDVGLDEDAKTIVVFTHKHTAAQKGSFEPVRQPRLPLDEEDDTRVTIRAGGREATLTGKQFDKATREIAGT